MFSLSLLLVTLTPVLGADIMTVASNNNCQKIVDLIYRAGLNVALQEARGVTFFAPNDAAVDQIPKDALNQMTHDVSILAEVIKFHVVSNITHAADISNNLILPTLSDNGAKLRMNVYNVSEMVIQSLIPPVRISRNKTVVTAEGAPVIHTDLVADNGLVHIIDRVVYSPPISNIPLTLTFDKDLGSLAYLIYQANLIEPLANTSVTVFAPTNAAFDKIPGQLYNDMLMNFTLLKEVVFTHVVKGIVFSSGLSNGQSLTNLQGTQLAIQTREGGVTVNHHSRVTRADFPATNGVIHVIDTVIWPN